MKSTIQRLHSQNQQLQTQLQQEVNTSRRLRHVRDKYRSTAQDLADQIAQLQLQLQQHNSAEEKAMYNSDNEDKESVERKVTSLLRRTKRDLHSQHPNTSNSPQARNPPASQRFDTKTGLTISQDQGFAPISQQSQYLTTNLNGAFQQFDIKNNLQARYTPVSQHFNTNDNGPQAKYQPASQQFNTKLNLEASRFEGSNKHYFDVPNFYGDPTEWKSWQLHLDAKFRASATLFPTERSRIDYIRDHCKSTAFNTIKARCLRDASDPYTTSQEILENLNNMYGEFDSYNKADATLHNPDFGMQKNKTFDQFLTRYTATIAPLQLSEQSKISQLTRTITRRLRFLTINEIKPTVFKNYVQRLRQCDLNMRLTDQQYEHQHGHQYHDEFDNYSTDQSSKSSKSNKTNKTRGSRGYYGTNQHSDEILNQLRHEGKCFRCQKPGHMAMDQDAPCRGKKKKNNLEKAIKKD